MIEGGHAAVQAGEDVVGTRKVRELERRVRDLERLLGRKTKWLDEAPGLGGCLDEERALAAVMPQAEPASSPSFAPVRAGTT